MALTDNPRAKKEDRTKRRAVTAEKSLRWSDAQKLEAVTSWLALGNLALTARVLNIPEITLRVWKASEWWQTCVEEVRLSENIQLSSRMKRLVEASHVIVAQRLETGDPVLLQKTGEIVYKPVSMKDAHKVAVDLIDRQKDIEKLTNEDVPTDEKNDDKLEKLAEKFAEMATKSIEKHINKRRTVENIEEVTYSAPHDTREEGLSESFGLGENQSPGEAGPEGGAEQSSSDDGQGGFSLGGGRQ